MSDVHQELNDFILRGLVEEVDHIKRHSQYALLKDTSREVKGYLLAALDALFFEVYVLHALLHSVSQGLSYVHLNEVTHMLRENVHN